MLADVDSIVEGKVTGITPFGAFVCLEDGRTGMVHISEVADEYIQDISQHLHEGQIVKVKILSIDKGGKIRLSIKKASSSDKNDKHNKNDKNNRTDDNSFEDIMAKFLKDSGERMQDLKRNVESKRGGGYSRRSAQFF